MHLDPVRRFNFYVILLAFVCLFMLLHTIRRVDIPFTRIMQEFNSYCNSLQSNRNAWMEYREKILQNQAADESFGNFDLKKISKDTISILKSDGNKEGRSYDSFTEVLSDPRMYNRLSKRSTSMPADAYYAALRTTSEDEKPGERQKSAAEKYLSEYRDSQPLQYRKYGNDWLMTADELSFLRAWCIQRDYRVNWKRILGPCMNYTKWTAEKPYWTASTATAGELSYIFDVETRPAGQFSRFYIQSVSQDGSKKTTGGDSWRVHITGASSIPATIVDHESGIYEVLFLVVEPGEYSASVVLDYTLCDGIKDPPKDWFIKGNSQGKYQHPDVLPGYEHPFLLQPISGGLNITVSAGRVSILEEMSKNGILEKYCPNPSCLMTDGFGRWANNVWKPYLKEQTERDSTDHKDGWLWIYGDSVGDLFYKSISKRVLCQQMMAGCDHTYNWVYKIEEKNITQAKMLWDTDDFSIDRVISELDNVLSDTRMNDHSVVIINMGLHYAQGITFSSYQQLIKGTIDLINSHLNSPHGYHGKVIWKTTTALFKERYGDPKSGARHAKGLRFLTVPRVQLYNAYATSAMCSSGIDVLDVYPMSDSYPAGTGGVSKQWDAVHFESKCFKAVEDMLQEYLG